MSHQHIWILLAISCTTSEIGVLHGFNFPTHLYHKVHNVCLLIPGNLSKELILVCLVIFRSVYLPEQGLQPRGNLGSRL